MLPPASLSTAARRSPNFQGRRRRLQALLQQETAAWYVAGGGASAFVYIFDDELNEELSEPTGAARVALDGGDNYGNATLQLPLAIGWWMTGVRDWQRARRGCGA